MKGTLGEGALYTCTLTKEHEWKEMSECVQRSGEWVDNDQEEKGDSMEHHMPLLCPENMDKLVCPNPFSLKSHDLYDTTPPALKGKSSYLTKYWIFTEFTLGLWVLVCCLQLPLSLPLPVRATLRGSMEYHMCSNKGKSEDI